jgi:predicted component of type VI protein secretion system
MKLKLIVLAGAKEGLEIPLKKDKFLIGRAKECALRAGSDAISRQHCAITRHETHYTVRDLGSRNGTYVNGERISTEVPLKAGNELSVGPLKFRVDAIAEKAVETSPAPAVPKLAPAAKDQPRKQPPVKGVADVVQRTINKSDNMSEDDVSRWLLGVTDVDGPETLKETKSLRAEDTPTTISRVTLAGDSSTIEDIAKLPPADDEVADETAEGEVDVDAAAGEPAEAEEEGGSGVWKFFKRGNKGAAPKKKIGKLPPRSDQGPLKDSRSAAADILREMQRRR